MYEKFGVAAISQSVEAALIWGGDRNQVGLLQAQGLVYSSAIADAGNTPTTHIRPGLLVAQLTSSGELEEWDADASDGTQNLIGVNPQEFSTLDEYATAVDKIPPGPIVRGPLVASALYIQGTALTSHADEYLARYQLHRMGIILDDDPQGYLAGVNVKTERVTGTTDVLTASQNGTRFIYSSSSAVAVTLPAIKAGLRFSFVREGDQEMDLVSAEGDNIIMLDNLTADEYSVTTASEHIGAYVSIEAIYVNTTLHWLPSTLGTQTVTAVDA